LNKHFSIKKLGSLADPMRIFIAILIASLFIFAPIVNKEIGQEKKDAIPDLKPFASSADACPWACIKCTSWDEDSWPRGCLTYECTDASGDCGEPDPGGGGGGPSYSPPTVTASIACSISGGSGWCVSGAKAVITASDPQGFSLTISGSVDSTPFTCLTNPCEVALPVGQGTVTYSASAATSGMSSGSGSINFKFDNIKPVINESITGINGTGGWWKNASFSATSTDAHSGSQTTILTVNGALRSIPFTVAEGANTIVMTVSDVAGNTTSKTWNVNVDSIAPTITPNLSGVAGDAGWYRSATFTASSVDAVSGVKSISITDNGAAKSFPFTLSDGTHVIVVTAVDNAGNISTRTINASVDSTVPVISPSYLGTEGEPGWWTSTLEVNAAAGDHTSGIAAFEISRDGGVTWQTLPQLFDDGIYAMILRARDKAGNVSTVERTLSVDTIAPTLKATKTGTFGKGYWYITPVNISLSSNDEGSGVWKVEYRINGGVWKDGSVFQVTEDGPYSIDYRVTDRAGNVFTLPDGMVKDAAAPGVTILTPSKQTIVDKNVIISGSSDDATSGLDAVEISIDNGKTWFPLNNGNWSFDFDSSDMKNGELKILSRAFDKAGNHAQSESTILLANHGPQVSIPDQWIYTEAGGLSIEPQYFEISSVTVTITNNAGEVIRVTKSSENPGYIAWDGKQNGELLPAGDYPVVVVVCDTNNKCSTTAGWIEIPAFNYIIPTPEQEGKSEEIVVVPPAPVVEEKPMPIIKFASAVFGSSRKAGISIAFLTGGVLLLFAVQNISDPRPRAMRSLAGTIRKTMIPKE
jgi:hypothetical protein